MPRGRYLVGGEVEEFACAAGPAGWRYTSVRPGLAVDLTLDSRGRPYRVELATADWVLRGGSAGDTVLWLRRPAAGTTTVGLVTPGEPSQAEPSAGAASGGTGSLAAGSVGEPVPGERSAVAHGFLGDSPGFSVAVARLLRLAPGQSRRLRLVEVTGPALATRVVDVEWRLVAVEEHVAGDATLAVRRYDTVPLDTGDVRTVHLAGDVVVAADGVELLSLDSPPEGPLTP